MCIRTKALRVEALTAELRSFMLLNHDVGFMYLLSTGAHDRLIGDAQAWALYGFTLSGINTGDRKYIDVARKCAKYFIANIREDGLTDCDFRQPKDGSASTTSRARARPAACWSWRTSSAARRRKPIARRR